MRLKNEALVGMVVTAGMVVLAIGAYWMTGRPWSGGQREVTAAFRDVGLLSPGNRVKMRGVTVGRVEEVTLLPGSEGVAVEMTLTDGLTLPSDVGVVLAAESFFGDWQAEIVSRSQYPDLEFVDIPGTEKTVIPGAAIPDITELTAVAARIAGSIDTLSARVQIAFTVETAERIRETIFNVRDISEQFKGFVTQQTRTYDEVSRNVLQSTANIRDATRTVEQTAQNLGGAITPADLQQIMGNARTASENLRTFSVQLNSAAVGVPGLVARADTTLLSIGRTTEGVNVTLQGLQPVIAELQPTLVEARNALATLQRAAALIEEGDGTLGRLIADPALYEETQRAIVTLRRLLADLQQNPGKYIGQVKVF